MISTAAHISRLSLYLARMVSLLALIVSGYMLYVSWRYFGKPPPDWGDHVCVDASLSKWGYWLKMPIALPGMLLYLGIFVATLRMKAWDDKIIRQRWWRGFIVLVTVAAASGVWLLAAQIVLLRYVCPLCLIVNLAGPLLFIVFMFLIRNNLWMFSGAVIIAGMVFLVQIKVGPPVPKMPAGEKVESESTGDLDADALPPSDKPPNTDLSGAIFGVEGTRTTEFDWQSQKAVPVEFIPIVSTSSEGVTTTTAVKRVASVLSDPRSLEAALVVEEAAAAEDELNRTHITLAAGEVYLDLSEVPIIGSRNAPYVVAVMYDYSMPSCLLLMRLLLQEVVRYQGDLAIILLPTPMGEGCNEAVRFTPLGFEHSCEYALASMNVWITNPEEHLMFEGFMSQDKDPQLVHNVQWLRDRLMAASAQEPDEVNRLSSRYINRNCRLWKDLGFGGLPKLIYADKVTVGAPQNRDDMARFMLENLGVAPPPKREP